MADEEIAEKAENAEARGIKYPKISLLVITYVLAYLLFLGRDSLPLRELLSLLGYAGTFVAGAAYAYGFTAAPATALLLIIAKEQNVLFAGLVAGLGALAADLVIFYIIRHSIADELEMLSKEKVVLDFGAITDAILPPKLKEWTVLIIAGCIIASPLPDEVGVSMLASARKVSTSAFSVIAYALNTTGILIVLAMGKVI
ncbi:MAG: hypothetical protein V1676_07280 [Candidatus Diapherotrites archaeon]